MSQSKQKHRQLRPKKAVAGRYSVSTKSIERWSENPELGFPKPIDINGRKFWFDDELEAFEQARVAKRAAA